MAMASRKEDLLLMEDQDKADNGFAGVRHMTELGVQKLPANYVLPETERPNVRAATIQARHLPVIDISGLGGPTHAEIVTAIGRACQESGFFQVVNHGISESLISDMMRVGCDFFALPLEERKKHMSDDMRKPMRYGTSFNQLKDRVFCWRDFLKHYCHPVEKMVHFWPPNPPDYRRIASSYSEEMRSMAENLMGAIVESLGLPTTKYVEKAFKNGSQVMVVNCYPLCPEPELTLGMPPHTDYGCITIVLQDTVAGLQVLRDGQWETVQPVPNSFIINVGDHLEILSNGKYKSVMHRVVVNLEKSRVSVATLLSMPFEANIGPASELIDEENPPQYRETTYEEFLNVVGSNPRALLDSVKLHQ